MLISSATRHSTKTLFISRVSKYGFNLWGELNFSEHSRILSIPATPHGNIVILPSLENDIDRYSILRPYLSLLIADRKTGRWLYYQFNVDSLNSLHEWIDLLKENSTQPRNLVNKTFNLNLFINWFALLRFCSINL